MALESADDPQKPSQTRSGHAPRFRPESVWLAALFASSAAVTLGVLVYLLLSLLLPKAVGPNEVVKTTLTLMAGLAAVLTGVYAYRKQRLSEADGARADADQGRADADQTRAGEVQLTLRYSGAAEQLGHEKAAVRLAGVYAMARLADDWPQQRQQCIDVLCAYLRMPNDGDLSEREVRATIVRTVAAHLQKDSAISWSKYDFDFTGAALHDAIFDGVTFSGEHASFDGATFSGNTSFDGATFSGERTSFDGATFSGEYTTFDRATFSGERTSFDGATFSGEHASFDGATFSGYTSFIRATFPGDTGFGGATFSGNTSFIRATFSGERTSFDGATFSGKYTTFGGATFSGDTGFDGATFSGDTGFDRATFSGEYTSFVEATFSGNTMFDEATFSGEYTSFVEATFSGGTPADAATVRSSFVGTTVSWGPLTPRTLPSPASSSTRVGP